MSDTVVLNSIDTDGSSNRPDDEQHINNDSMMGYSMKEEFASPDLEGGSPDPITELPAVATSEAQPTDVTVNDAAAAVEPVEMNWDRGLLSNLSSAAVSASLTSILQPTPKGLYSHNLLTIVYTWDVITLLVLAILLYGLTLALDAIPDRWLGAVRATVTAVAFALLLLLVLLAAFVGYGLIFRDIHH